MMDIFTTQLTRVAPNRIQPDKLKVKSLSKEAKTQTLDEEHDHLDHHEESTVTHQHAERQFQQHQESSQEQNQQLAESDDEEKSDDDKPHHLDIFV